MVRDQSWGRQFLEWSAPRSSFQRQTPAFLSSQLHGEASSDRQFLERSAQRCSLKQHSSGQLHGAVSSDKQFGRYSNNGVLITEAKAISLSTRFFFTTQSTSMGVAYYQSLARATRSKRNGTEIHLWYAGDRTVLRWIGTPPPPPVGSWLVNSEIVLMHMRTCGQLQTILTPFKPYHRTDRGSSHTDYPRSAESSFVLKPEYYRFCSEYLS